MSFGKGGGRGFNVFEASNKAIITGHKDALYQTALAEKLPFTTFRFDLSGNGESEGQFNFGHILVNIQLHEITAMHIFIIFF